MQGETYQALAAEIIRIVESPYPTQFLDLRQLISDEADIKTWAASNHCIIDRLVACLLQGLTQWPYVLEIISKLATDIKIRDAFLQQEPSLLPSALAEAVKANSVPSRYSKASVSLLSNALPDHVAIPAEAQTLFVRLVQNAARKPSATTIEPIYLLLKGTGRLLLQLLTPEILGHFQETIMNILREGAGLSDQCLSLYCLSIMTVIAATEPDFRPTSSDSTSDFLSGTSGSGQWKSDVLQQFLSGNRASKTVQLVVLVVLAATRGSEAGTNANKSLVLANEVICAIPAEIRGNWCAANVAVIRKLQEKACAGDVSEVAQLLTLRFIANLCGTRQLPEKLFARVEATFTEYACVREANMLLNRNDGLDALADIVHRGHISNLIFSAISYITTTESQDVICLDAFTAILRDVLTIGVDKTTAQNIFTPSLTNGLMRLKQSLDNLSDHSRNHSSRFPAVANPELCIQAKTQAVAALVQTICRLLLEITLAGNGASSMSASTQALVLDLFGQSSKDDSSCQHKRPAALRSLEYVEQSATQDLSSADWRSTLKARFGHEADAIIQSVSKACAGLESRCENIEAPLKEATEKYRALEQQNMELSQAYAQMEAHNIDYGIQNHALEDERDQAIRELEDSRSTNEKLLEQISEIKSLSADRESNLRQQFNDLKGEMAAADVTRLAALSSKESALEDLRDRVGHLEKTVAEKDGLIANSHRALEVMQSERAALESSRSKAVQDHEHFVEASKQESETLREALKRLQQMVVTQENDMKAVHMNLEAVSAERDSLSTDCESARQQLAQLENVLSEARQERQTLEQSHQQAIATTTEQFHVLQKDFLSAKQKYQSELESHRTVVEELQSHILHLQSKCERKSAQIIEANVLRSNLLAAMGVPPSAMAQQSGIDTPYAMPTTLSHRSRSPSLSFAPQKSSTGTPHLPARTTSPSPRNPILDRSPPTPTSSSSGRESSHRSHRPSSQHPQQKSGLQTNPPPTSFASTTSFSSGASSIQHGPTPKRARSRRSSTQQQPQQQPTQHRPQREPVSPLKSRNSVGPMTLASSSRANTGAARRQTMGIMPTMMDDGEGGGRRSRKGEGRDRGAS